MQWKTIQILFPFSNSSLLSTEIYKNVVDFILVLFNEINFYEIILFYTNYFIKIWLYIKVKC